MFDYMYLCLANPSSKDLKMLVFWQQLRFYPTRHGVDLGLVPFLVLGLGLGMGFGIGFACRTAIRRGQRQRGQRGGELRFPGTWQRMYSHILACLETSVKVFSAFLA